MKAAKNSKYVSKGKDGGTTEESTVSLFPPPWLNDAAKKKFTELCGMIPSSMAKTTNTDALATLAEAYTRMVALSEQVEREGETITQGEKKVINPAYNAYVKQVREVKGLLSEFGLTPRSQSRSPTGPKTRGSRRV